ncbi:hypothetical protein PPERSA_04493 [Pseudocohnilembus persalinus]|uniref:Tetratricopeptide repeat protein n=1 Tax=Pseudocohnilembus persalinus TaxID=266149 RepID=A0A0V0QTW9_PSEPJ|nr:hypothetical protein PPERSA_04493 [Pseudocohnilembus persalinus]|eukprot:KRX05456.1 hypothetical protein PPERSA_04493 [Pseudocohnilembus persalinus]
MEKVLILITNNKKVRLRKLQEKKFKEEKEEDKKKKIISIRTRSQSKKSEGISQKTRSKQQNKLGEISQNIGIMQKLEKKQNKINEVFEVSVNKKVQKEQQIKQIQKKQEVEKNIVSKIKQKSQKFQQKQEQKKKQVLENQQETRQLDDLGNESKVSAIDKDEEKKDELVNLEKNTDDLQKDLINKEEQEKLIINKLQEHQINQNKQENLQNQIKTNNDNLQLLKEKNGFQTFLSEKKNKVSAYQNVGFQLTHQNNQQNYQNCEQQNNFTQEQNDINQNNKFNGFNINNEFLETCVNSDQSNRINQDGNNNKQVQINEIQQQQAKQQIDTISIFGSAEKKNKQNQSINLDQNEILQNEKQNVFKEELSKNQQISQQSFSNENGNQKLESGEVSSKLIENSVNSISFESFESQKSLENQKQNKQKKAINEGEQNDLSNLSECDQKKYQDLRKQVNYCYKNELDDQGIDICKQIEKIKGLNCFQMRQLYMNFSMFYDVLKDEKNMMKYLQYALKFSNIKEKAEINHIMAYYYEQKREYKKSFFFYRKAVDYCPYEQKYKQLLLFFIDMWQMRQPKICEFSKMEIIQKYLDFIEKKEGINKAKIYFRLAEMYEEIKKSREECVAMYNESKIWAIKENDLEILKKLTLIYTNFPKIKQYYDLQKGSDTMQILIQEIAKKKELIQIQQQDKELLFGSIEEDQLEYIQDIENQIEQIKKMIEKKITNQKKKK